MRNTVVYVDVLIFVNTIISYCILQTVRGLLHLKEKLYRIILSSFVGGICALVVYLPCFSGVVSFFIKTGVCLLMSLTAFRFYSLKEYLKITGMTVAVSFVFCGVFIAVFELFHPPNMALINDVVYFEFSPLVMIALTVVIYLLLFLIKKLFSERIKSTVVRLKFTVRDRSYECIGKIDTACKAVEPFSGDPVVIVEKSVFNTDECERKRVIPYHTLCGSSLLYAVKGDTMSIDDTVIRKSIYIGSVDKIDDNFKAIINSEIIR